MEKEQLFEKRMIELSKNAYYRGGTGTCRSGGTLPQSPQRLSDQRTLPLLALEPGSRSDGRNPHPRKPDLPDTRGTGRCREQEKD